MGFMEANDGRDVGPPHRSTSAATAAIDCFVRYFGPQAADPIEYLERDWMAEEFSRGCYGAHFTPGVWTAYGDALRDAGRPHPLGRRRVLAGVERLHGGRGALRRDRRPTTSPRSRSGLNRL